MNAQRLRRAARLPLLEAGLFVLFASVAIRTMQFARIMRLTGSASPAGRPAEPAQVDRIRRAVLAWSRRVPWNALCFEQGLAAHWMLRRRKFQSSLHYGAATRDGAVKAHVWVRSGTTDVVGCENASDFALLAIFPERQGAADVSAGSPHSW